MTKKTA